MVQRKTSDLASMYRAELHNTVDKPWVSVRTIRIGPVPLDAGKPGVYVTVERNGVPVARIDAWPPFAGTFTQAEARRKFIALGWNDHVYLVDPITSEVISVECDGYFGHLYPVGGRLLVADASRLVCLNEIGERLWESDALGTDGVVVNDVRDGVVIGEGEWDPPGGWKPFRLMLATGEPAAS